MREIKFRVWQPKIKSMARVESFDCARQPAYWFQVLMDYQREGNDSPPTTCAAINRKDDPGFILMQYVGLKDKNGDEIYEGDIVRLTSIDDDPYIHEVVWEKTGYFTLKPFIDPEGYIPTLGYFTDNDLNDSYYTIEIIGNIYKNPELLKKK